jgi:hypothetical protein
MSSPETLNAAQIDTVYRMLYHVVECAYLASTSLPVGLNDE